MRGQEAATCLANATRNGDSSRPGRFWCTFSQKTWSISRTYPPCMAGSIGGRKFSLGSHRLRVLGSSDAYFSVELTKPHTNLASKKAGLLGNDLFVHNHLNNWVAQHLVVTLRSEPALS